MFFNIQDKEGIYKVTGHDCREVVLNSLRTRVVRQYNTEDNGIILISKGNLNEEEAKTLIKFLKLPIKCFSNKYNIVLVFKLKDFINFNFSLSTLLYYIKYANKTNIKHLLNKKTIKKHTILVLYKEPIQDFLNQFVLYCAAYNKHKDFSAFVLDKSVRGSNGIVTFLKKFGFNKYPELLEYLKEYISYKDEKDMPYIEETLKITLVTMGDC